MLAWRPQTSAAYGQAVALARTWALALLPNRVSKGEVARAAGWRPEAVCLRFVSRGKPHPGVLQGAGVGPVLPAVPVSGRVWWADVKGRRKHGAAAWARS